MSSKIVNSKLGHVNVAQKQSNIFEEALVTWQFDALFFSLSKVIWLNDHQKEQKKGVKVKATLYKYKYCDSKLLVPIVCFPELVKTSSRTVWAQQHVLLTGFLPGQARRN